MPSTKPGHVIDFEYDPLVGVRGAVRCAIKGDWCRTDQPTECHCEEFTPEQDDQGWFHRVTVWDETTDTESEVVHRHTPSDQCMIAEAMNNDDGLLEEGYQPGPPIKLGTLPITTTWEDGYYSWVPRRIEEGDPE